MNLSIDSGHFSVIHRREDSSHQGASLACEIEALLDKRKICFHTAMPQILRFTFLLVWIILSSSMNCLLVWKYWVWNNWFSLYKILAFLILLVHNSPTLNFMKFSISGSLIKGVPYEFWILDFLFCCALFSKDGSDVGPNFSHAALQRTRPLFWKLAWRNLNLGGKLFLAIKVIAMIGGFNFCSFKKTL